MGGAGGRDAQPAGARTGRPGGPCRIHAKILGARIDGATQALRTQAADYRAVLARLQAAAAEGEKVAALAGEQLASDECMSAGQLAADLEALRSGATLEATRRAWRDNGLPEESLEVLGLADGT